MRYGGSVTLFEKTLCVMGTFLALLCYEKNQKLCVMGKSCKYFEFPPKATKLNKQFFCECLRESVCVCECVFWQEKNSTFEKIL